MIRLPTTSVEKALTCLRWLPSYAWQRMMRRRSKPPAHVVLMVANHFEPGTDDSPSMRQQRIARWCSDYQNNLGKWVDSEGVRFRHTFFFPAEQDECQVLDPLIQHCHEGWGEIEIHLHHGVERPDTSDNTRQTLLRFRDSLAARGCLSRWDGAGSPRYGFVHGNWALANSRRNVFCGVDDEMQILADTGCYADFTLPSAPDLAQTAKINSVYECSLPLDRPAPHRRGRNLRRGCTPANFPLIIQGPLMLRFNGEVLPRIENSELSRRNPPTVDRFRLWCQAAIGVDGHPDWVFVKVHCHGLDERDLPVMHGTTIQRFLSELTALSRETKLFQVHFATARQLTNMVLAACDGRDGNPASYHDYRLKPITRQPAHA